MDLYYKKNDWRKYIKSLMKKWRVNRNDIENYGWMGLNFVAWTVCVHSNNKKDLATALLWINMGLSKDKKPNPAMIDTKANILYKIGDVTRAIDLESEVVNIYIKINEKDSPAYIKYYQDIASKMKKGEKIRLYD